MVQRYPTPAAGANCVGEPSSTDTQLRASGFVTLGFVARWYTDDIQHDVRRA